MNHIKRLTIQKAQIAPNTSSGSNVDLPFIISSLQLVLTVLQAVQTKKAAAS
ncbi:MAG TPA: hypothetical protein PKY35_02935 [Candidatus Hydrogenedentes bacterium]|nr:hypothetical protein [Candidatus Hydrogenedentota bacterium]HOL75958.1 hypothetical protein [Candidatus Hydrogenedentota bacterium]HPO85633.1 hypothetical protein [Candidatus Hydrogenedentota bacterium]